MHFFACIYNIIPQKMSVTELRRTINTRNSPCHIVKRYVYLNLVFSNINRRNLNTIFPSQNQTMTFCILATKFRRAKRFNHSADSILFYQSFSQEQELRIHFFEELFKFMNYRGTAQPSAVPSQNSHGELGSCCGTASLNPIPMCS